MAKKSAKKLKATKSDISEFPLTLRGVRLLDCTSEQAVASAKPLSKFSVNAKCDIGDPRELNGSFLLCYRVGSEVLWASEPEGDTTGSRLAANCRYEVQFVAERRPSATELEEISNLAVHCCWPYLRTFFSFILKEMGQPPFPLPLLRIDPKNGMRFLVPSGDIGSQPTS